MRNDNYQEAMQEAMTGIVILLVILFFVSVYDDFNKEEIKTLSSSCVDQKDSP